MYPRGLMNIGNTCYINTVIQCLGFCHAFVRLMLTDENKIVKNEKSILWQLCKLYKDSCHSSTPISTTSLVKVLHTKMNVYINVFEQNDINEFLNIFLDKLNDEISGMYDERPKSYDDSSLYDQQRRKMDISWENHHKKSYSELIPMFYGQMISQIVCGNCKAIHHNHEVIMNIMVSVNEKKNKENLQQLVDNHLSDEYVDDGWMCDNCKKTHKSTRSFRLWRIPSILVITVKRFNKHLEKINTCIDVPMYLDIDKHSIPQCSKYVLRSIAFHTGNGLIFGGHYYALGLDDNNWTLMDDETVTISDTTPVDIGKGYVFFYESLRSKKA